jgi:hypothetical protein
MRMPLVTFDFAPDPSVSLYMRKILFYFLSVWYPAHCMYKYMLLFSYAYFQTVRQCYFTDRYDKVNVRAASRVAALFAFISALGWLGWEGLLAMSLKENPPLGFMDRQLSLKSEVCDFLMLNISSHFPEKYVFATLSCVHSTTLQVKYVQS